MHRWLTIFTCRRSAWGRVGLGGLLALAVAPALTAAPAVTNGSTSLATAVNTFIGTKDEGNTFPGASAPFGQIQVSPIGSHYSGWQYSDDAIRGFGHSFVSGAGCWGQGGQVSVLPVTGSIGPGGDFDTTDADSFDQEKYAAAYTHEGEVGDAGYYKVRLTDYGGVTVEATARTHAAAVRYTFDKATGKGHLLINVGQANPRHSVKGSVIHVVDDDTIKGRVTTHSFCGGHEYTTWFRITFSRPFQSFGIWDHQGGVSGARNSMEGVSKPNGAWVTFDLSDDHSVTAISAISHVGPKGARINLEADGMHDGKLLGFAKMRKLSRQAWNKKLSTVKIDGASADDRAVFYSALYHAYLQPMTGNDADGRYRGYDNQIHDAEGWTYYEYFSLWDTYRTQNQWLAMTQPAVARDIAHTILAINEQSGWLPRWGFASFDTNVMTGDPVTPFLVDLWRFGALEGREDEAWAALRKNAFKMPPEGSRHDGRSGNASYQAHGYVVYDLAFPSKGMDVDPRHGGSATLEYALADCSLSYMAAALGHDQDAAILRANGGNWHNVWDASVVDEKTGFKGFPRPRVRGGAFYQPPRGPYSPRSQRGFHEGTAWQYQWLVQQDIPGLVKAMHGRDNLHRRLDTFFAMDALRADPMHAAREQWVVGPYSYYDQYRYNPNNEPDLHSAWIYTLTGQPWKTDIVVRAAQQLFTNAPDGVTGNDDLGTMSAWYLFSAVGLYPVMPGSGRLLLHTPRYPHITMSLGHGNTLEIHADGADGHSVQFIQDVSFNGHEHGKVWLDWDQLRHGGELDYQLGSEAPTQGWGTDPADAPTSRCVAADARG
ncbi:MAG TPA: GH92 family glycosyl hydrolase [Oleiagrimonas sp.]|nr:GH92 family glycosyl hydrolase [Oleiagrimonas sp.]